MNKFSFYLLFLLPLLAVLSSSGQVKINLQEPVGDNFIESELFGSVSFVPLTVENPSMISHDMELKYIDNQYFLLDNKFKQCIYRFDSLGTLINIIGGEQVLNPVKFTVNPYLKQVEIYNFEESEIRRYTYQGKKIDRIGMSINPSDFIRDKAGNYWIYLGWNNNETAFRLLKADKTGKVTERQMRLITKCTPTEGFALYDSGNGLCLWEVLGNETFMIKDNAVKKTFSFDFGPYALPSGYHMMTAHDGFITINNTGYYTTKKYLENDHFAYFFLNFTKPDQKEMIHIIYDKRISKAYIYTEYAGIGAFDKAHDLTDEDELVFLVSGRKIGQFFGRSETFVPEVFSEFSEQISGIRVPIVVKIKLQSFME